MSQILAINLMKEEKWNTDIKNISPYYADLFIGFDLQNTDSKFRNLQFGFEVKLENNIISYGNFPSFGVKYITTDQKYLTSNRINYSPDKDIEIKIWRINNGIHSETKIVFKSPIPDKPYESWIWDGEVWTSPIPYPEDGKEYHWNEEGLKWDRIDLLEED